jgi:hypothetical protein
MEPAIDLREQLLSRLAGILEDASSVAASAETLSEPAMVEHLRNSLLQASALLAAVEVLDRPS